MSSEPAEAVLNEMLPYFEAIETQSAAIVRLLKDKKITDDKEFAEYLEQAGNASGIRWQAARLRMERLFASAEIHGEESRESVVVSETETTGGTDKDQREKNKGKKAKNTARTAIRTRDLAQ